MAHMRSTTVDRVGKEDALASLVIGSLLGVVSSIVAWWAVARRLGPSFALSSSITVVPTDLHAHGRPQRFKVVNRRRRGLSEVRAVARLRIRGLPSALDIYPNSRLAFDLALSSIDDLVDYIPGHGGWIFTFDPFKITSPYVVFLPTEIQGLVAHGDVRLVDFLSLGTSAEIEVFVSATDAYSGSRRTIATSYTLKDVTEGYFRMGGLDVVAATDGKPPENGH
jgi:hypothetical protein